MQACAFFVGGVYGVWRGVAWCVLLAVCGVVVWVLGHTSFSLSLCLSISLGGGVQAVCARWYRYVVLAFLSLSLSLSASLTPLLSISMTIKNVI